MATPRRKLLRLIKVMIVVSMLGSVFVFVRLHFFKEDNVFSFSFFTQTYTIGKIVKLKLADKTLTFMDEIYGNFLKVKFDGDALNSSPNLDTCASILGQSYSGSAHDIKLQAGIDPFKNTICLKWKDTVLVVNDTRSKGSRCYSVAWLTTTETSTPKNCFSLSGAHWYGGSLLGNQQWPLEDVSVRMQPYVSAPLNVFQANSFRSYGPVLERMWMNSAGFGIVADSQEPLHVSVNANDKAHLCLKSQFKNSRYLKTDKLRPLSLKYTVCMDRTTKLVHGHLVKEFITLPDSPPSEALMQDPVWSTRGINTINLTQSQALDFQMDISKRNFLHSQLHIAGNFTRSVGSMFFDHARFPNAHQMVGQMTGDGFSVSTSILPVLERGYTPFNDGLKNGVFVNISETQVHGLMWNNKSVAMVDFTNPAACQWMAERLKKIRLESTVAAFHFDSGEALLLAGGRRTHLALPNHCDYSRHYVKFAHSQGNSSVVGVGFRSQQYGLMVDIGARASHWGYQLGLQSVIPSVLTLGLLGYPFLMAGPVGGVVAQGFDQERNWFLHPDKELYIRWLQLSVFLPGVEISVGPWQYDTEVVDTAHALLKLRAQRVLPALQTATQEFLRTGAPLIRPLWWMATEDETAQRVDCEFLVSNSILVAPVLEPGARQRNVYLPKVKDLKWQDDLHGEVYAGGQWLKAFKVGLTEVATFRPVYKTQAAYHLRHDD